MPKPGWAAVLQGEPADLEDWAFTLKEPFEPWMETYEGNTLLRSSSFDELTSANDVRERAVALVERLNGAVALSEHAGQLRFGGGIVQFDPNGKVHHTMIPEPITLKVRGGMMRPVLTQVGPDGKIVPPPPPQQSEVQKWSMLAESDDLLDDALIYFGRGKNWFDVYKTLECIILVKFSGKENAFFSSGWAPEAKLRLLKQTANWARHAKRKFNPPSNPMSLDEGYQLLAQLLRRALT
jgi:hypothetical protein